MRILSSTALCLLLTAPLSAQNKKTLLFTGRFPSVSLDVVNERPGGSLTQIEAHDLACVTPSAGAIARSWVPTTAHQAFNGDPDNTGNYTKFDGLVTYYEKFHFAGCTIKHQDKSSGDPRRVYYTVRDIVGKAFNVFTNSGTKTHTLRQGDFFRWLSNGDVEFFITQDILKKATGPLPSGSAGNFGASAICQDAAGNLYFSPPGGGSWIHGNNFAVGPEYANDGSICMIANQFITYDAIGNVSDVVANSASILWAEIKNGPVTGPSMRDIVKNANVQNNSGTQIISFANVVGLEIDPNGGTQTATYPVGDPPNQVFPTVPNLIFTFDNGTFGGTIVSTANSFGLPGSVAVINGVKCGSDVSGNPADASWLGVKLDIGNFQPTMMGLALIDELTPPTVLDMPMHGSIDQVAPTTSMDASGPSTSAMYLILGFGPNGPGLFASSIDVGTLLGTWSWNSIFTLNNSISVLIGVTDPNGYVALTFPNPNSGAAVGLVLLGHAVSVDMNSRFQVSNPIQLQYK